MKIWTGATFAIIATFVLADLVVARIGADDGVRVLSGDCVDSPNNWFDSDGDDCDDYDREDWCDVYGDGYKNMGKTANEVRC